MNIDLVYYFREVNHYYFLNGPEKVNGNIINNSPSYQFSSANDVVTKINQMIASLAPDITNVGIVTSELYTGNIQVNTYRGELNVSSAPDYTSILTSINTNLTNLNDKFTATVSGSQVSICKALLDLYCVFSVESPLSNTSSISGNNYIRKLIQVLCSDINNQNTTSYFRRILLALCGTFDNVIDEGVTNKLQSIVNSLKQSVSPNASITDVISALNTNIHNDLTNINTTENNKDTVLIIDGQQEFKLHKDDE